MKALIPKHLEIVLKVKVLNNYLRIPTQIVQKQPRKINKDKKLQLKLDNKLSLDEMIKPQGEVKLHKDEKLKCLAEVKDKMIKIHKLLVQEG